MSWEARMARRARIATMKRRIRYNLEGDNQGADTPAIFCCGFEAGTYVPVLTQERTVNRSPSKPIRFEGTCDVCGAAILLDYDFTQGLIDYGYDNDRMFTWVRHYATAPRGANPDCAVYSSRVYEVDK